MFPCQLSCSLIMYWIWMPASESLLKRDQSHDKDQDLEAEASQVELGHTCLSQAHSPLGQPCKELGGFQSVWGQLFQEVYGTSLGCALGAAGALLSPVEHRRSGLMVPIRSVRTFQGWGRGQQSGNDHQEEGPAGDKLLILIHMWHVSSRSHNKAATPEHDSPETPTSGEARSGD